MTSRSSIRLRAHRLRPGESSGDCVAISETIGRQLRSGSTLSAAVRAAAQAHPHPWCRDVVSALDHGRPLADTLDVRSIHETSRRRPDADLILVLQVLAMAARVGGEPSRHVDALTDTLRARRRAAADRLTHASTALASIRLLTWLPVACAVWMVLDSPAVRHVLLASPVGWSCLAAGAFFNVLGRHWTNRLVHRW